MLIYFKVLLNILIDDSIRAIFYKTGIILLCFEFVCYIANAISMVKLS